MRCADALSEMFVIGGTWRGNAVRLEWHEGVISGDTSFCAAVTASLRNLGDSEEVLLAAGALLADDETFYLGGGPPKVDEPRAERRFRPQT